MATGNAINANSTGLVKYNGTGTFSGVTPTNHAVQVGDASNGLTSITPSVTSGVPLVSQGAAADPVFGTTVVAGGGTGQVTLTNHGVLIGQGTSAVASTTAGTAGQVLTSNGASADPTFQAISASGAVTTLTGNSGGAISPTAGNINVVTANSTVTFVGSGSSLTHDFNQSNLVLGSSLPSLTTGTANTGIGFDALKSVAGGVSNVCIGYQCGDDINSGNENVLVGRNAGGGITGGGQNICIGQSAGSVITSGSSNILIGKTAGNSFSNSVSNNICIGEAVSGSGAVSNSIRIGGTHTTCFIDGISGVTVSASAPVGVNSSDQLSSLGFGTAGQLFVSGGAGVSPAFASSASANFTFGGAATGSTRSLTIANTDNTSAASSALSVISVGGTSAGDPYTRYVVGTTRSYAVGIDNDDTQAFVINTDASGGAVPSGGTQFMKITSGGNRTLPLNSCCSIDLTTGLTNVTGDGTFLAPVIFDTESSPWFDANSNYNPATGVFTAPVTGKYLATTRITFTNLGVAHVSGYIIIQANSSNFLVNIVNPYINSVSGEATFILSGIIALSATNTLNVSVQVAGGTKTVGVKGNSFGSYSSFSVVLVS